VEISCRVYKPRRPRESPLYRLVEQHLEELLRSWPGRFARQHGPLLPVVERVLRELLLWAEWLREGVLLGVAHRHVVITIPRLLRPLLRRRRELLGELARAGAEVVKERTRLASGGPLLRRPSPPRPWPPRTPRPGAGAPQAGPG